MNKTVRKWMERLAAAGRPDESETKSLLRQFGIAVPRGMVIGPADAVAQRLRLGGSPRPPWVAKICSATLLHKTEHRGVLLNLNPASLPGAVEDLRARFPRTAILVEEYVDHEGPEFIIGAMMDPTLGAAVMVGAGGIHTELYADAAFRLSPCPVQEAMRMLAELTVFPVLQGYRGSSVDAASLAVLISQIGEMALQIGEGLDALDVNPVVYSQGSWVCLDAKLVLQQQ